VPVDCGIRTEDTVLRVDVLEERCETTGALSSGSARGRQRVSAGGILQ
jgi:hypothetical protein